MKTKEQRSGQRIAMAAMVFFFITMMAACTQQPPKRNIPDSPYTQQMGNIRHHISKDKALSMLRMYDRNRDSLIRGGFAQDTLMMPIAETFNLTAIDSLLAQKNIAALRTYIAMDPVTRKLKIILVGVNKDGKDVLQDGRSGAMKFGGGESLDSLDIIVEEGNRWP